MHFTSDHMLQPDESESIQAGFENWISWQSRPERHLEIKIITFLVLLKAKGHAFYAWELA